MIPYMNWKCHSIVSYRQYCKTLDLWCKVEQRYDMRVTTPTWRSWAEWDERESPFHLSIVLPRSSFMMFSWGNRWWMRWLRLQTWKKVCQSNGFHDVHHVRTRPSVLRLVVLRIWTVSYTYTMVQVFLSIVFVTDLANRQPDHTSLLFFDTTIQSVLRAKAHDKQCQWMPDHTWLTVIQVLPPVVRTFRVYFYQDRYDDSTSTHAAIRFWADMTEVLFILMGKHIPWTVRERF